MAEFLAAYFATSEDELAKSFRSVYHQLTNVGGIPDEQPAEETPDVSIDLHLQLFKDAMLKVQTVRSEFTHKTMILHTYDWVAAERLGKDIGLLKNHEELCIILKDENFVEVPKNSQNLTPYRKCIDSNTQFPFWQCGDSKKDGLFRHFLNVANTIYSLYKIGCEQNNIKPYGSI